MMKYEQAKLRWYFAVATFDSQDTAGSVYDQCDGLEFQRSGVAFDLRVVDDGEQFSGLQVRLAQLQGHCSFHHCPVAVTWHGTRCLACACQALRQPVWPHKLVPFVHSNGRSIANSTACTKLLGLTAHDVCVGPGERNLCPQRLQAC